MAATRRIVVTDQRVARLLSLERTPGGRWRAKQRSSLDSRWEDYHERKRPSPLGGRSASRREHQSPGFSESEIQEGRRRFARDVVQWLECQCNVDGGGAPEVFAAPGFFGVLRDELESRRRELVMHEVELTRLRPEELAAHPAIRDALRLDERNSNAGDRR